MSFALKYVAGLPARGRLWTVQIFKQGYTGLVREYAVGLDTKIEYGINKASSPIGRRIFASSLSVKFLDPRGLIFEDFNSAFSDLSDFRIRIEDSSGVYRWTGRPKLKTSFHPVSQTMRRPETELLAYDGLVDLKDEDAIIGTNITFHNLVKQLLVDGILEQPIEYAIGWKPIDVGSSGAVMNKIRFTDTSVYYTEVLEEGRPQKYKKRDEQLADVLLYLDSEVYQTIRGKWRVSQSWLNGIDISEASRTASEYDHLTDSIAEVALPGRSVLAPDSDGALYSAYPPIKRVNFTRGFDVEFESLDDSDFIRGGDFQSGLDPYWILDAGGYVDTVKGIRLNDNGTIISQKTLHIAEGSSVYIAVDFNYGMEYTPTGANDHFVGVQIVAVPSDPSDDTYYITGAAGSRTWTTTPSTISPSLPETPNANGFDPNAYSIHNFLGACGPLDFPVNGQLEFRIVGDTGTDFYLVCDDFIGKVGIGAANPIEKFESHFIFAEKGETLDLSLNLLDIRHHIDPVRFANPLIESDFTISDWGVLPGWLSIEFPDVEFRDILELVAQSLRDQASSNIRLLKTTVTEIVDPSTAVYFQGDKYKPLYIGFTLHTESSEILAIQDLKDISV